MDYTTLRNIAGDGDICFLTVNSGDFMSRLTSWWTKSPYTHAAILFWYKERLMLIESTTSGGIRIVQASTYSGRNFELVKCPLQWSDIQDRALARSGTAKYGWFSAVWIGFREFMFKYFEINLPPNSGNRNKACSEFVAEVLGLEDVDISPRRLHEVITAGEFS